MTEMEVREAYALALKESRMTAKLSQSDLAKRLGVSETTVQNWENGYTSIKIDLAFRWFQELGVQPLPYFLDALYPHPKNEGDSVEDVNEMLYEIIDNMTEDTKRKLLFILRGDHGGSPIALVELLTMHCGDSLQTRIENAEDIQNRYNLSKRLGRLKNGVPVPNEELVSMAIQRAESAAQRGETEYTAI